MKPGLYEELRDQIKALSEHGVDVGPTPEERADWVYGNTVIENPDITREMAKNATD